MMTQTIRTTVARGLLVAALALLPGCSVFQGSREIDMTPFAENTAMMFSEAAKVSRPARWTYLKPYAASPAVAGIKTKSLPLIRGLRGIVMYSNQLVSLNMSSKSDAEKNRLLAAYLREAAGKVANPATFDSLGINPAMLDSVFVAIERAPTFREGIQAAGPLVNGVVLALNRRLDEIDEEVPIVIGAIDREIESEYATKRTNYDGLVRLQTEAQASVTRLYDARRGDPAALAKLLEADPSLREYIISAEKPTPAMYKAAEEALTARLARLDSFLNQLEGEKKVYFAKQEELETLRISVDEKIKVARDAVMIWAQSHRNLGQGIAVPPLFDVVGMAGGLAKKVVPLP
jgi:hypothetical protein